MSADPASAEDAVELFLEARSLGQQLNAKAFAARYPAFAPDLERGLDALLALERATSESVEERLPARIGAYRIVREIGRGGMGVVLEAVEEPLGRRVALKVLPPELLPSASTRARFQREAALASRLDHPGIATVYGAGVEGDQPWIAMRYIEGRTLASSVADARSKDASCVRIRGSEARERDAALAVAACVAKVAQALHTAHEQGVVHRDIKPSNILVTADGSPVLLDFGVAIAQDHDEHTLTKTGETPGTPAYFSPESVAGDVARPDAQSDVYALGVTLYECLSLRRPFDAPTPVALYRAILAGSPPALRGLNPSVSRDLAVIVATAMERERGRRYASAQALAQDLEACVAGRPIAARPVPLHGRLARWIRREPRQASLAGLLGAAAIALALFVGNFWASRSVVRAAEKVAGEQDRERSLAEGYFALRRDSARAEAAFARVLGSDPHNLDALAGQILVRLQSARPEDASALLADAPASPGFDALRAYCRGDPIRQDAAALSSSKSTALDLFLVGVALKKEGERTPLSRRQDVDARALSMLNEAVVRSPGPRAFMHIQRGLAANTSRDERAARSASATLLAHWPDSKDAVFAAGLALANVDPRAAVPILERAAELDPTSPNPFQVLANVQRHLGDYEASELWCWRALARGRDAEIYNSLAITYQHRGCDDDAILAVRRAVAQNPRSTRAWGILGSYYAQRGEPTEALFPLQRLLDLDPMDSAAHTMLGTAYSRLHRPHEARAHLEHAVALDPDALVVMAGPNAQSAWVFSLTELTSVLWGLDDRDAAYHALSVGLETSPTDPDLLGLQARFEAEK